MKKIIIFSILFIGLFFGIFNFVQAETRTFTIPLEQENVSLSEHIYDFIHKLKQVFLPSALAEEKKLQVISNPVASTQGKDIEVKDYFTFSTYGKIYVAQKGKNAGFKLVCNKDVCILEEESKGAYEYDTVQWKITHAILTTISMDDSGNANHFDDYDQCIMALKLVKSLDYRSDVATSDGWIKCARDWSNANSIAISLPPGFANRDDIPSGAGFAWVRLSASGGSWFGDIVRWVGEVEATGQRPSLDSFTLTAKPQGQTTNSTIRAGQSMTVCKGENLKIEWSTSDSSTNILYVGATNEHKGGETLTVAKNGSINRTAYITTNFIFTVKGYAGEDYEQTFASDDLYITVVDCVAPTFSVDLTAIPDSGTTPLNDVDLDADVSGTATGNIVYKFDCTNNGTWEHTSAATTKDPYSIDNLCDYATAGTYTAKVQATRGSSTATDTVAIDVSATLSASLSATPSSGTAPLNNVVLTADPSGTATGTINYTFYCNRADAGTNITAGYIHKLDATNTDPYSAPAGVCNSVYSVPGTYTAKVIVERGSLATEKRVTVTVLAPVNNQPTAINLSLTASDVCYQPVPFYTFNWTYSDPDTDKQSRYILQIDNNSDFSSPQVNLDITGLSDPSPSTDSQSIIVATNPGANQLAFNTTYYWRTRVYDEHALASNWTNGTPFSFTTPVYHYPSCDFTWNPSQPNSAETVIFTDASRCWDEDPINGSDCSIIKGDSYLWTITSGDPSSSTEENASSSFSSPGNYNVILQVTDSGGHTCSKTKPVRVNYPVPKWKEILPW